MKYQVKKISLKLFGLACMMSVILFSSCSSDDDDPIIEPYHTGTEAITAFRGFFYNTEGVNAFKQDHFLTTEWAVPIDQPEKACILFNKISGMDVKLTDKYNYSYQSVDGKCSLRLEGNKTPVEAVYGTLYVNIPDCPEIHTVLLVTPEYFDNKNEWEVKW